MNRKRMLPVLVAGLAMALAAPASANVFADMDANKDGKVSGAEFSAYANATFNRVDGNRDDKLTVDEIRVFLGVARTPAAGRSQFSASQRFQRRDANQDGVISRTEFTQAATSRFQELDANHNNELTDQELAFGF